MQKSGEKVQDIADRLSENFQRLVPLQAKHAGKKRLSPSELAATSEQTLQQFYALALQERQRHSLGIIARARIAIGLQKRLLAAGYPVHVVKKVVFAMLTWAFAGKPR